MAEAVPLADREVLIVSHGFGYGGDLMYFGEIFQALRALLPRMAVVVDDKTQFANPYRLPLLPLLHVFRKPLRRTAPDGQIYETEVVIPSPMFLPRLLRRRAAVLVTIEFTPAALITVAAAVLSRRKLVLMVESDPARRGGSASPLMRRIKRWAVARADVIQTNNAPGRRYLVEDLGARPERVRVAPYLTSRPPGPATVLQPPAAPDEADARPLRLLFANGITPRKGLRQLLDAIALLDAATRAQLDLTVVGDGPEREELERFATGLGMGDRVRFLGRRAYHALGTSYAEAEVLAIPSLADYRSLAGFEGLGYGLVLLASRFDGATEETVQEGINGFAIDPSDPDTFAKRIATLVHDRAEVSRMRRASLDLYDARFSVAAIARNIADSITAAAPALAEVSA